MKKMGIAILSICLCAIASYLIVYSVSPDVNDMVYDIDADVMPAAIPSTDNQYRFNQSTGKWQVKYGNLAGWGDVPNYFNLNDVMNEWGVALLADLPTASDFQTALQDYFSSGRTFESDGAAPNQGLSFAKIMNGIWPQESFIYSAWQLGNSGPTTITLSSIPDMLSHIHRDVLNSINYYPGASILTSTSHVGTATDNLSLGYAMTEGFLGLGYLLGGGRNPNGHSFLQDIKDNVTQLNNDIFPDSLTPSGLYIVGRNGESQAPDAPNLAIYLRNYLSAINQPLVTGLDWLDSNGETQANIDQLNVGIAEIAADGFLGLATILRGSEEPWAQEYTKINYADLSEQTVTVDNILDAIMWPLSDLQHDFAQYLYSHGTDLDIKERENMNPQAEQFVDDFTSADGQGTPTTGQISDTAGVSGGIKDAFSGSSSPADAFTQITDSDNYSFLSTQTQSELNPFFSSRYRSSDIVDFVGPKLNEIQSGVGSSW